MFEIGSGIKNNVKYFKLEGFPTKYFSLFSPWANAQKEFFCEGELRKIRGGFLRALYILYDQICVLHVTFSHLGQKGP